MVLFNSLWVAERAHRIMETSMTITQINNRPIWWQDAAAVIHICEGDDIHRNVRLFWTLCGRDVPANKGFHPATNDRVTCEVCIAAGKKRG